MEKTGYRLVSDLVLGEPIKVDDEWEWRIAARFQRMKPFMVDLDTALALEDMATKGLPDPVIDDSEGRPDWAKDYRPKRANYEEESGRAYIVTDGVASAAQDPPKAGRKVK